MTAINWTLLCDYAFMTEGRKLSLIGVFENIHTKSLPAVHLQLFVAVNITINPEDRLVRFSAQISAPSGNSLRRIDENPLSVSGGTAQHNSVFGFYSLPFEEPGDYHVEVFANGQSVHLVTLPVILVK